MTSASQSHLTTQWKGLRWAMPSKAFISLCIFVQTKFLGNRSWHTHTQPQNTRSSTPKDSVLSRRKGQRWRNRSSSVGLPGVAHCRPTPGWLLRPAHAGDVVNYSDFMESINKGEVEMVRVQQDMLSAQYTTKDTNMHGSALPTPIRKTKD